MLAEGVQEDCLAGWLDHAWDSPDAEYVNKKFKKQTLEPPAAYLTPEASPEPTDRRKRADDGAKSLPIR